MRFQLITILIFTFFFWTAVTAERLKAPPTTILTHSSPYFTRFSERDSRISYRVWFKRAFSKKRRDFESFCSWVWGLVPVIREVKPIRYARLSYSLIWFFNAFVREDIFHLRLQEDTMFISTYDIERSSAGSESQTHLMRTLDNKTYSDECVTIFTPFFYTSISQFFIAFRMFSDLLTLRFQRGYHRTLLSSY